MVDYTTGKTQSSGLWLMLAAGAVGAILLYALFAGGNPESISPAPLVSDEQGGAVVTQ